MNQGFQGSRAQEFIDEIYYYHRNQRNKSIITERSVIFTRRASEKFVGSICMQGFNELSIQPRVNSRRGPGTSFNET